MTEDEGGDFDTSETASLSSELSTSTQATSVASDDTITAKDGSKLGPRNALRVIHPAPTATTARVKPRQRTRPLNAGETSTAVAPRSAASGRRTLHIQVTPSQELAPQQKKLEKDLRLKIEQLESETHSLRDEQARLLKELDSTSDQLSTTGIEKDVAEKERNRERDTRQLLYSDLEDQRRVLEDLRNKFAEQKAAFTGIENERDLLQSDLEEQRRILDEFRSNFDLQKGTLEEAEKERDELREAKEMFEEKATKLGKDLEQALEERKDHDGLLFAQIAALELTRNAMDSRIDTRDKEIVDLTVARDTLKKESEEQQTQIKTLAEEKETQVKILTEEKDGLSDEKKAIEEEKAKVEASVAELTEEKDKEIQDLQDKINDVEEEIEKLKTDVETLTADKDSLQKQVEALETEKTDQQATIDTLTVDLGGAKDANITLASQKLDADSELEKVKEELTTVKEELTTAKEELATAQSEVTKLEEVKKDLESENEDLKSQPVEVIKVEEAPAPEASEDAPKEDAPASDDRIKKLEEEAAKVVGLAAAKAELETKISELQAEADKVAGLAEEKAALEAKTAELEQQAGQLPALAGQNQMLVGQLAEANARLGQIQAAHQAATAQVQDLQAQVAQLRARQPSQSRSSSRKRKSTADSKALVVVRNPADRGSLYVVTLTPQYPFSL